MHYVSGGHVKDVTQRYDSNFMSHTRKLRVDKEWWDITLLPYKSKDTVKDQTEDLQLQGTYYQNSKISANINI